MAKVFIFGMGGLIVIGLITLGIVMISGSVKASQKMLQGKKEESDEA